MSSKMTFFVVLLFNIYYKMIEMSLVPLIMATRNFLKQEVTKCML